MDPKELNDSLRNSSSQNSSNTTIYSAGVTAVIASILAVLTLVCIIGNTLVILAILRTHKLKTPSNYLIVSLAVSDWLVGIIVMPLAIVNDTFTRWPLDKETCSMWVTFDVMLCTASILNLMMISIDRYLVITQPFEYGQRRTSKFMLVYISVAWVLSLIISVSPMIVGWEAQFIDGRCMVSQEIGYQIYATLGAFYLPLVVMIALYGKIFYISNKIMRADARNNPTMFSEQHKSENNNESPEVSTDRPNTANGAMKYEHELVVFHKHKNRTASIQEAESALLRTGDHLYLNGHLPDNAHHPLHGMLQLKRFSVNTLASVKRLLHRRKTKQNSQAIKTLGVIMGLFTACWLPFFILAVVGPVCECAPSWIYSLLTWLGYANSCLNPVIYARFNRDFRTPFHAILCCKCHKINESVRHTDFLNTYGGTE